MLGLGGGLFTFAALFYFAADYEHLSGWKWALASCAVTITINQLFPASFIFVLPAQFGLFLVMWWAHTKNKVQREAEREQRQKDAMRERQQRVSQPRDDAAADADSDGEGPERKAAAHEEQGAARGRARTAPEGRHAGAPTARQPGQGRRRGQHRLGRAGA